MTSSDRKNALVLWFDELDIADVPLVGGKSASLGEMYRHLTSKGVKVPNGFAVTAYAYHYLLRHNKATDRIRAILDGLDTTDMENLSSRGSAIRSLIRNLEFPEDLTTAIVEAYRKLSGQYGEHSTDTAVRSSATAEDLPDASFAGQQETYLNVKGHTDLLEACKKCFASLFTNRAIAYRMLKGFDHFSIGLSIGVQKMVRSDLASSGVMFSIDTESGFADAAFITAAYGLGENVVQGSVNPDQYYVFKPTLEKEQFGNAGVKCRPIISRTVGSKDKRMIYDIGGNKGVKNVKVPLEEQAQYCLTDDEVLQLARWAVIIEDHYSAQAGYKKPMDIEWAKDGASGELFIVQARPETVHSQRNVNVYRTFHLKEASPDVLISGNSVGEKIGSGRVMVIKNVKQIDDFEDGCVLVTEMTDPDWAPVMARASAIVTNSGGRTCHAAIVSRELGIPCVVGTGSATVALKNVSEVTVDCSRGSEGFVYAGVVPFDVEETDLKSIPKTQTRMTMIIGNPDSAFEVSRIPNDGVGLARLEFIISNYIHVHPLLLTDWEERKGGLDKATRREVERLTVNYEDKSQYLVDRLAEGMGTIAAAFYPKDVIVRMSDFKTNEYAHLLGGDLYEPKEDNPMLGWRGASRYYDPRYERGFRLECEAILKVRREFGLDNVKEGQQVLQTMEKLGLSKGVNGLRVYAMCEIPSNVILAERFLSDDLFDGFSIGSNDLTQLVLGLDRDAGSLSHIGNEMDDTVKEMMRMVIEAAKKKGKYVGICGQGPSDFPDLARFLVELGISSLGLQPDSILKTTQLVHDIESGSK